MKVSQKKIIDLAVIGSGLSSLNFVDTYLSKKLKVHIISPDFDKSLDSKKNNNLNYLPSQMRGKQKLVDNFFFSNKLNLDKSCNALGALTAGGLSNFWGLQLDNHFFKDQKELNHKNFKSIQKEFIVFLKRFKLLGKFYYKNKTIYKKDYEIPKFLDNLLQIKNKLFKCEKPILAYISEKNKKNNLNKVNEESEKLVPKNFLKRVGRKKKIIYHNYYVDEIFKIKNLFKLVLKNKNNEKIIFCKKIVFAAGSIATTKILMKFLKINSPVKIKHHPRLFGLFFSRKPIYSNLNFTPSLLQIKSKSKNNSFVADLRPGNKFITESLIEGFPFLIPFKFLINFLKNRLIFSNILLDSSQSNMFLKRRKSDFTLYCNESKARKYLVLKSRQIFKFLYSNKIILPIYKTHYPGAGADYHYFGSIPFKKKGKLAVNNNCQLLSEKNIYVVDGSIFDFKNNKYPLGMVIANARRIGKLLSK